MDKINILLLASDEFVIDVFKESLDSNSYHLFLTADPEKVVESAISKKIDMFFVQMEMPGVDGYEICGYLNDIIETKDVVSVMIVTQLNMEIFDQSKKVGVSDFLVRPLYSGEVEIKIENILRSKESFSDLMKKNMDMAASHVGYSVEHYIGQPLTAIMGAVEVIKLARNTNKEIAKEEQKEIYDIIISASQELSETIRKFGKLKTYKITEKVTNKNIVEIENLDESDLASGDIQLF